MPKQRITPDDFVKQVADTFRAARPTKRTLTQQSGDAGTQGGQKFVNPMDGVGQMIAGGESGALEQVPAGTEGQVVKMTDVGAGVLKPRFADEDAAVVALLDDIGDVNAPTPSNGDVLTWDSTPGEWVPAAPTGGGSGAPTTATYITQTPDAGLSAEQALSSLSTGLVKVTTGTGVLSTATPGTDYVAPDATLTALAAFNTNGLLAQTAADTFAGRTLTGTTDQIDVANGDGVVGNPTLSLPSAARTSTINFVIDGGGAAITTGIKGDVMIDAACTITAWTALADQSGSIVVDIWGDSYANFPPVVGDSITTSEKPTISTATKGQDTSLNSGAGWAIAAGTILRFNVDSITSIQRCTIALKAVRS